MPGGPEIIHRLALMATKKCRCVGQKRYVLKAYCIISFVAFISGFVFGCKRGPTDQANAVMSVTDLNRGLAQWIMVHGGPPKDFMELTNLPFLKGKAWPNIPAGKKLTLDASTHLVVIADE
jgi:hypothetical protein